MGGDRTFAWGERGTVRYHVRRMKSGAVDGRSGQELKAAAILDRLLHRSHVFNIKGRSYRLRDLEEILKKERA